MVIFSAVLLEKRVMFVGSPEIEAGTVCEMVLAAANMLSPPFPLLPARTFPYANLNDLGFLDVPGYIAGVTNPLFKIKSNGGTFFAMWRLGWYGTKACWAKSSSRTLWRRSL